MINKLNAIVGKSLNDYSKKLKPVVNELKFKEAYQGRIIDLMVGEVDDNYIETPETDSNIVKLEYSKEGIIKIPTIKGKTIIVDKDGNETHAPGAGCRYISVGEDKGNKLIISSNSPNILDKNLFKRVETSGVVTYVTEGEIKGSFLEGDIPFYFKRDNGKNVQCLVYFYDENKKLIQSYYLYTMGTKYTINKDSRAKHYILMIRPNGGQATYNNDVDDFFNNNYDIRISIDTWNDYKVYQKPHKTEILLSEPLRSLPNGVCDEIIGNKLIRRVGIKKIIAVADEGIVDVNAVD